MSPRSTRRHAQRDPLGIEEHHRRERGVSAARLDEPEHGLTEEVLGARPTCSTWWGHAAHDEVADEVVDRVHRTCSSGMGLVVLHSGHWSKIFGKLMGTSCTLRWRSEHDRELVWTVNPDASDRAGRAAPDRDPASRRCTASSSTSRRPTNWSSSARSPAARCSAAACTFRRGNGKIFYFSPGDQDFPVYHHNDVRRVIANGVGWAKSDRPEREVPTLLRYETGDFFTGHGYQRPDRRSRDASERRPCDRSDPDRPGRRRRDGARVAACPRRLRRRRPRRTGRPRRGRRPDGRGSRAGYATWPSSDLDRRGGRQAGAHAVST